jgi:hypothetical protein
VWHSLYLRYVRNASTVLVTRPDTIAPSPDRESGARGAGGEVTLTNGCRRYIVF